MIDHPINDEEFKKIVKNAERLNSIIYYACQDQPIGVALFILIKNLHIIMKEESLTNEEVARHLDYFAANDVNKDK